MSQYKQVDKTPIDEKDLLDIQLAPSSPSVSNLTSGNEVLKAIVAIQAAVLEQGGIAKSHSNDTQKYMYRSIYDMYRVISPLMVEHQVTFIGNVESCAVTQFLNKNKEPGFKAVVLVRYTLTSTKDGSFIQVCFTGEANDNGDKAVTKALSLAKKAFYEDTFAIPTGNENSQHQEHNQNQNKPRQSSSWGNNNGGYRNNNTSFDNRKNKAANKVPPQPHEPATLELKNEIDERMKRYGYRLFYVLKDIGLDIKQITDEQLRNVYAEFKKNIQSNLASQTPPPLPNQQRH